MKLNVLSIDWDYFIDATYDERIMNFPDGGNEAISSGVSNYVWSMRYGDTRIQRDAGYIDRAIEDMYIRVDELDIVKRALLNVKPSTRIVFADSHADIYEFVTGRQDEACRQFNIFNIDHHSDCYNIGEELNCGNWVNRLDDNNYISKYVWIKNEDSGEEKINTTLKNCKTRETSNISTIDNVIWDYIFICRSSVWSPPHLDKHFNELYHFIAIKLCKHCDPDFFVDRYTSMKKEIEDYVRIKEDMVKLLAEQIKEGDCTPELNKIKKIFADKEKENGRD